MKKVFSIILSVAIIISLAGAVLAVEKVKIKQIAGEVAAVDAAANSLTVKGRRAEIVITTTEKTSVVLSRHKKSLADVKIGDRVTVKYSEAEGKSIAKIIEIKPVEINKETGPAKPSRK